MNGKTASLNGRSNFQIFLKKILLNNCAPYLCTPANEMSGNSSSKIWEHSSAGSEHLPYKQRVRGSNPCAPTQYRKGCQEIETLFYFTWFKHSLNNSIMFYIFFLK